MVKDKILHQKLPWVSQDSKSSSQDRLALVWTISVPSLRTCPWSTDVDPSETHRGSPIVRQGGPGSQSYMAGPRQRGWSCGHEDGLTWNEFETWIFTIACVSKEWLAKRCISNEFWRYLLTESTLCDTLWFVFYFLLLFFFIFVQHIKPEDHWSCIAHLSAQNMLNKLGNTWLYDV